MRAHVLKWYKKGARKELLCINTRHICTLLPQVNAEAIVCVKIWSSTRASVMTESS